MPSPVRVAFYKCHVQKRGQALAIRICEDSESRGRDFNLNSADPASLC